MSLAVRLATQQLHLPLPIHRLEKRASGLFSTVPLLVHRFLFGSNFVRVVRRWLHRVIQSRVWTFLEGATSVAVIDLACGSWRRPCAFRLDRDAIGTLPTNGFVAAGPPYFINKYFSCGNQASKDGHASTREGDIGLRSEITYLIVGDHTKVDPVDVDEACVIRLKLCEPSPCSLRSSCCSQHRVLERLGEPCLDLPCDGCALAQVRSCLVLAMTSPAPAVLD